MPQHARPEESSQPPRPAPTGIFQVVHLDAMEHAWAVAPGIVVHGYGYNAQVPGPTVEATVGDTLLVRFTNSLTEPTSICWHLPGFSAATACMDPAAAPVQPGGTVEYPLQLIDAGTYWYHARLDDSPQTDRGLYGALVVRHPADPCPGHEQVLIFADFSLGSLSRLRTKTPLPPGTPDRKERMLLVNGVQEPQMLATAGHRERWRLVNTTSETYLLLSLSGQQMTVAETSGDLLPAPVDVHEMALAPGESRDMIVGPFAARRSLTLQSLANNRGSDMPWLRLARLHVAEACGPWAR